MTRFLAATSVLTVVLLAPGSLAAQQRISLDELARVGEVDSAYATPGLRDFIGLAADAARDLPALLESYRADVESEISIVQGESTGRETALQVEQVASEMLWRRDAGTVQRVTGYRSRTVGVIPSLLTMFEVPWVVPTLYGDRIDLVRFTAPVTSDDGRVLRRRAVHPLGADRARVYRFTGGDTILTLRLPDREIPLVRIHVEPVATPDQPTLLFQGHMDLDATRHQIVRMRGRMISSDPDPSTDERLLGSVFAGATYVEFETAEYDGRFWLPRYQRIEVQAVSRLTDSRIALRVVSSFDHPWLNDPGPLAGEYPNPPAGGLLILGDTEEGSGPAEGWRAGLGELTADANTLDFRDLEPGAVSRGDGPSVGIGVRHLSHLLRFNPVEGVFTGLGLVVTPGRRWPEGRVRVHAGWAWQEETVRGGVELSHADEGLGWEFVARGERTILPIGDFGLSTGREVDVPPLGAGEEQALYDHRVAGLVARQPRDGGWSWRLEAGWAEDRMLDHGRDVPDEDETPLPPTLATEGDYGLARVTLERNPGATGFGVIPGTAVRLHAEAGRGDLDWTRLEAGVGVRRVWGSFSGDARMDGGVVLAEAPPPQRLFELGRYQGLNGYDGRAFAGDRVALVQGALAYTLPLLRRPLQIGGLRLPAIAPAPTVILRAGWTDAGEDATPVLETLGIPTTDGVRSSLGLRLRLFGGGFSFGFARPLDAGGEWQFVWSVGREF